MKIDIFGYEPTHAFLSVSTNEDFARLSPWRLRHLSCCVGDMEARKVPYYGLLEMSTFRTFDFPHGHKEAGLPVRRGALVASVGVLLTSGDIDE